MTKIIEHDFSKGVSVTDHFIKRAQERFGIRDLHDKDKNRDYATNWAMSLLDNYDAIESAGNDKIYVRCQGIVIVFNSLDNACITCYPVSYNSFTKTYDDLATIIKKNQLKLDDFNQDYVKSVFVNRYYQEKQLYAKELSEQHAKLAKLYKEQSVSKKREVIDDKQELINQAYSIIHAIEAKIQNIHDVIKKL
ncbi:hypothetical protein [Lactobacillus bombicola]|uniref:Uncharacterized protein n=1 Tax=Lactobacillus bombicola TaxID=1505723 RepID=A0ABX9LWR5_9LACO|nr:hypothetical protein [Lactobacillus bombicola]RHW48978.1 hypothetical protein DS833_05575 [Lactobacillus bombicola]RHW53578.1 hypothetical protein DS834_01185 [Lactobacillus bombicola]